MKTRITILTAALFAAFVSASHAGPANRSGSYPTRINTKEAAMECCLPNEKVALACKDCKTLTEKPGTDKKGILGWFKADSKHDCLGCRGTVTVNAIGGGKGPVITQYRHVCSKCGPDSAYTCATHKK